MLAEGEANIVIASTTQRSAYDSSNWHYEIDVRHTRLDIGIDAAVYVQILDTIPRIEAEIYEAVGRTLRGYNFDTDTDQYKFESCVIKIKHNTDSEWRDKAKASLRGEGISNQGRVRSENIAPIVHQGLLFRSRSETRLFDALKKAGIIFAPLPVFVKNSLGRRVEPDFLILHKGIVLVVEVDGVKYHKETPAEAHERLLELNMAGVETYRITDSDCADAGRADSAVSRIIAFAEQKKGLR